MAALTPVDIANMALGILTEAPIDSLDEDSRAARLLNLHYETTREAEISKRDWVFAIKTAEVDPAETGGDWTWAYELPDDALRVMPIENLDWIQQGGQILTRCGGARKLSYIANVIDPTEWPSLFVDVLAAALAIKVAHPITAKANMVEAARAAYSDAVSAALRLNAVQKRGRRDSASWLEARGGSYSGIARARHGAGA